MNIKWSPKAVEGLNLDLQRSSQRAVFLKLEPPYDATASIPPLPNMLYSAILDAIAEAGS